MDFPNPENVIIKQEPGTGIEGGGEVTDTLIEIEIPDIKQECLEYTESTDLTVGKT